jgi:hypothetical protein
MIAGDLIYIKGNVVRVTEIHPEGWHVRGHGRRRDGEHDHFIFYDKVEDLLKKARKIDNPIHVVACAFMGI